MTNTTKSNASVKTKRSGKKKKQNDWILPALLVLTLLCTAVAVFPALLREDTPAEVDTEEKTTVPYHGYELPLLEDIPVNRYDGERFLREENGSLRYPGAKTGIDVSSHQEWIDWEQVAGAGIEFAMIRVGRRGYTEGGLYPDEMFVSNYTRAVAAGIDVGVYFFSQAVSVEEAEEEALYLLDLLDGRALTYPVFFDWETISGDRARTDDADPEEISRCAAVFCKTVADAGYTPGVYFNMEQGYLFYRLEQLAGNVFWLAEYHDRPAFYYDFGLWQYSEQGSVPGISGMVDLDLDLRGALQTMEE